MMLMLNSNVSRSLLKFKDLCVGHFEVFQDFHIDDLCHSMTGVVPKIGGRQCVKNCPECKVASLFIPAAVVEGNQNARENLGAGENQDAEAGDV
ncbi:hypothetical protein FRX31_002826 [Thalictrum thalictroides]|uniref:Uncharacterized protein n=1 Tax=Thalictrum thalictroides TaxID=46969 RepID=A0A7J6XEY6_THATH|nr:hypothetical protein FRX31_002826 [Thalictrum thalictroides]